MGNVPKVDLNFVFRPTGYSESDRRKAADLIGKLVRWVPDDRLSAEEALEHEFF